MGFEPGSLHSQRVTSQLTARRVTATPPSCLGSAASNSVVYLRSADRSMRVTVVCGFFA